MFFDMFLVLMIIFFRFGFVNYQTPEEANRALHEMNKKVSFKLIFKTNSLIFFLHGSKFGVSLCMWVLLNVERREENILNLSIGWVEIVTLWMLSLLKYPHFQWRVWHLWSKWIYLFLIAIQLAHDLSSSCHSKSNWKHTKCLMSFIFLETSYVSRLDFHNFFPKFPFSSWRVINSWEFEQIFTWTSIFDGKSVLISNDCQGELICYFPFSFDSFTQIRPELAPIILGILRTLYLEHQQPEELLRMLEDPTVLNDKIVEAMDIWKGHMLNPNGWWRKIILNHMILKFLIAPLQKGQR